MHADILNIHLAQASGNITFKECHFTKKYLEIASRIIIKKNNKK